MSGYQKYAPHAPWEFDVSLALFERLGVFADWKLPRDEEIRFIAENLCFTDIVIGLSSKRGSRWAPRYRTSAIEERISAIRSAGCEPVVMPWTKRRKPFIPGLCEWLLGVTDNTTAILLDVEEDWYKGSPSPEDAAEQIASLLKDRHWGCTGIGYLHHTVEPLAKLAKFNVPQCYSFWKPTSRKHWSHSTLSFPGPLQDISTVRWRTANPDAPIIMGNGCYWAARPEGGTTPELSSDHIMRFALIETLALGIPSTWFWSLKWILEKGSRGERVREFFGVPDFEGGKNA